MTRLRVLVVEDRKENVEAAKMMLAEHELTVVNGYDQAHKLLTRPNLDKASKKLESIELPEGCQLGELAEDMGYIPTNIVWSATGKEVYLGDVPAKRKEEFEAAFKQYREAVNSSYEVPFDVVLTDVMFPKGGRECMSQKGEELVRKQGEMPYGPVVALRALSVGIKRVGVLTQGSHHDDPFVFAFDNLPGFQAGDVKVVCHNRLASALVNAKTYQKVVQVNYTDETEVAWKEQDRRIQAGELAYVKDWTKLLEQVMS